MKKIVSSNYRGDGSGKRWLIREENQKPEDAVAVDSVVATGVVFRESTIEYGFGCSIVAVCNTAEEADSDIDVVSRSLRFAFDRFADRTTNETVSACEMLILEPDGSMSYVGKKHNPMVVVAIWALIAIVVVGTGVIFGPTILKMFGFSF